jgi:hypothetical protein
VYETQHVELDLAWGGGGREEGRKGGREGGKGGDEVVDSYFWR